MPKLKSLLAGVEGVAQNGKLDDLQASFLNHAAVQCGYCTPGMILAAYALLAKKPKPTRAEIVQHMDDNLCRCGSHVRVLDAVEDAAIALLEQVQATWTDATLEKEDEMYGRQWKRGSTLMALVLHLVHHRGHDQRDNRKEEHHRCGPCRRSAELLRAAA